MGVAALPAPANEAQGISVVVVPPAPQAVGAHQPQPITIARQALDVRFAVVLAAGEAEVLELHGAEIAVVVLAEALQPEQASALITPQPQHPVPGHQGGEVLSQLQGLRVVRGGQHEQTLLGRDGQGEIGFRLGHGGNAGPSSVGSEGIGGVNAGTGSRRSPR